MNNNAATVCVPIFSLDENGAVLPNPLFHRPWDKLHSRCVEYPYAASKATQAKKLLDVGTAKSDTIWMQWLDSLSGEVRVTDYDASDYPYQHATFHQADVRRLPFEDNTFDVILAVSVIEHIGLNQAQVVADDKPPEDNDGDVEAVRELIRVLVPNGKLVMTFPYGLTDHLILRQSARTYTANSLKRFERVARPVEIEYYEYQHTQMMQRFVENITPKKAVPATFMQRLKRKLVPQAPAPSRAAVAPAPVQVAVPPYLSGAVTWRRIPIADATATNLTHIEGVVCGVWSKLP